MGFQSTQLSNVESLWGFALFDVLGRCCLLQNKKESGCGSGIRLPGSLSPERLVERAALQDTMFVHGLQHWSASESLIGSPGTKRCY